MIVDQPTRPATLQEGNRLSPILAAAFTDDPIFNWLLPDDSKRPEQLLRFFSLELARRAFPMGDVWTGDRADGVSLELPSDRWQLSPRDQALLTPHLIKIFRKHLPRATALTAAMTKLHPIEAHYYIPYVGVAPAAQGQGLGSALVGRTISRCDREGFPAYLEATSERNAELYSRLGFKHLRAFNVGNSPPIWPMLRPPQ
jgi:GNAT superfamily N-acetyltransferase